MWTFRQREIPGCERGVFGLPRSLRRNVTGGVRMSRFCQGLNGFLPELLRGRNGVNRSAAFTAPLQVDLNGILLFPAQLLREEQVDLLSGTMLLSAQGEVSFLSIGLIDTMSLSTKIVFFGTLTLCTQWSPLSDTKFLQIL